MKSNTSQSIIMRIREFGESDLLVSFFTRDRGRIKGVAKGARKSRKRFPNCLDLFCLTSMEYELPKRGDLHFLQSCKLINAFPGLRCDFAALSLASYMVELTETLFPPEVREERIFDLMTNVLGRLEESSGLSGIRILFEARALYLGGYGIDLHTCCICGRPYRGEGRAVFDREKGSIACLKCEKETFSSPGLCPEALKGLSLAQSGQWEDVKGLNMPDQVIREIRSVLELHIDYRIGRRMKTSDYLS